MPMYDLKCEDCGHEVIDVLEPIVGPIHPCSECGHVMKRAFITHMPAVHQDTIDLHVKNGLCHPDGTPRHFTSKQEWRRATKEAGMVNAVRHLGTKGSDKSKHTTRWY